MREHTSKESSRTACRAHLEQYNKPNENKRESLCALLDKNACANTTDGSKYVFIHVDSVLWGRREGGPLGQMIPMLLWMGRRPSFIQSAVAKSQPMMRAVL